MKDSISFRWLNITFIIAFLLVPFVFLYIATTNNTLFPEWHVEINYICIIILGLLFSLIGTRFISKYTNDETKEKLLLLFKVGLILYCLFILVLTISDYVNYASEVVDVIYYHYTVWQLSQFKVPYIWGLNVPVWSQHFEPILIFFVPIYWVVKSAGLLFFMQGLIVVSGVIPIYLSVNKLLKSRFLGLSLALAYISFGGLQYGIEYGFHPIMLFPTVFFWAYYYYCSKNLKLYILFAILCLFVKEEASFIMLFWGIYLLLVKKDKAVGGITMLLGIVWYILCFDIIFPYFNKGNGFGYWGQYTQTNGTGVFGIINTLLLKPQVFISQLFNAQIKINTIFFTFGSFAFLLLLFPPSIIIVLPSILEKLLSNGLAAYSGTHYSAAVTGVTVVATVETIQYLSKKKLVHKLVPQWNIFFGILLFYVALFSNTLYGFYAYSVNGINASQIANNPDSNNVTELNLAISQIPKTATVTTMYQIAPHIYEPGLTSVLPLKNISADYVLIDAQIPQYSYNIQQVKDDLSALKGSNLYQLVINDDTGVLLFKKSSYNPLP